MRRARRTRPLVVGSLAVLIAVLAPVAWAGTELTADLEGRPIPLEDVGTYHCHDLQRPLIHCFADGAALDAAIAELATARGVTFAALAATYVQVFQDRDYRGAAAYLSGDYPNLSTIGWNDRISSFKALTSGRGEFREHAYYLGLGYGFCCGQQVVYVGDAFNDRFSSIRALP